MIFHGQIDMLTNGIDHDINENCWRKRKTVSSSGYYNYKRINNNVTNENALSGDY